MTDIRSKRILYCEVVWFAFILLSAVNAFADNNIGVLLTDSQGKIIYEQNRNKPYIPASILKILTSLAALETLGEDFRYTTHYSYDHTNRNLYIKGFGDPLLISEVISRFCDDIILKTKAVSIHNIILDHTFFDTTIAIPGTGDSNNPYDAPIGALCANFNTIAFKWDARLKQYTSAESQTPLLDIFKTDIKKTDLLNGRIILSRKQSELYLGQLLQYFINSKGVRITGKVMTGKYQGVVDNDFIFASPFGMKDIIKKLLQFSNNFIANQLFLTIGAATYGPPAELGKGRKVLTEYTKSKLGIENVSIFEGSGLSRKNQISPNQMIQILQRFSSYHDLLNRSGNDFFKTGTLTGIRTRAGYLIGKSGELYPYVIMVNQKGKNYHSILKQLKGKTGN
jgi:D-alanyl-D-alanine carboxypeptidase/D-alanyl-D-alanine-endopeptidase (penicillin-binding protein 4)